MNAVDTTKAMSPSSPTRPRGLRRLSLKLGGKAKATSESVKQLATPPSSQSVSPASSRVPSSNSSCINEPPAVTGTLESRWGKPGRILGDGATGTVQVVTNPRDGSVVAVKKFNYDRKLCDEKAFDKKTQEEFRIGSSVSHGNIIKMLEISKERGCWYEVIEYAPIELYEVSESRIMSLEEMYCAWAQILNGAAYLHKQNIAHRDLKLENVVMTEDGIMKIIDFGSAIRFRESTENKLVFARGYVGCEPYMAPEIFNRDPYDPRAVDVWSLAIIFCRLILCRYPWECAQQSDPSYKSFSKPAPSTCRSMNEFDQHSLSGPGSLLKELPNECRLTLKGMLQITPSRRLSLVQVKQHPWVKQLSVCSQDQDGKVHRAKGHAHFEGDTLTPSTSRKDSETASQKGSTNEQTTSRPNSITEETAEEVTEETKMTEE